MHARKSKSGPQQELNKDFRYFEEELHRSRKQAEMATTLMNDLIKYHHYFCGETNKSFARLHEKLRRMMKKQPALLTAEKAAPPLYSSCVRVHAMCKQISLCVYNVYKVIGCVFICVYSECVCLCVCAWCACMCVCMCVLCVPLLSTIILGLTLNPNSIGGQ